MNQTKTSLTQYERKLQVNEEKLARLFRTKNSRRVEFRDAVIDDKRIMRVFPQYGSIGIYSSDIELAAKFGFKFYGAVAENGNVVGIFEKTQRIIRRSA